MKIIIAGAGAVGTHLAKLLAGENKTSSSWMKTKTDWENLATIST